MNSPMDWPSLVPVLVLFWIVSAIVEVARLALAERRGRLPASPMLFFVWRWFRTGTWLTVLAIAGTAYNQKLISALAFGFALGVTSLALAGLNWLVQRLRHDTKAENGTRPAAS